MRRLLLLVLCFHFLIGAVAYAEDGGETVRTPDNELVENKPGGGQCNMQGFKEALGARESSGKCTARNKSFLGKYQLGKTNALVDIGYTDAKGNWKISGMTDEKFLNDCALQEKAMDAWIAVMAGNVKAAKMSDGKPLTSFIGTPIPRCPDKKLTFSGLLGGRHLCGIGSSGKSGFSGTCWQKKYTGVIAYFDTGGTADGVDGNKTPVSEYICKFNGFETPYEQGGDFSSCGTGDLPPSQPDSKDGFEDEGYYGDLYDPNPEVRHYKMVDELIRSIWIGGLQLMANQMINTMTQQVQIIGSFFDAKHQLETQRLFQQKAAIAHKDYQPSEQMCTIGTFSRNLANTDRRAQFSQVALSQRGIQREAKSGEGISIDGYVSDRLSRFNTFREKFCNPKDNAQGNKDLCVGNPAPEMINRDIDFTRTIDMPLTLAFDPLEASASDDEAAVYALMDNLFHSAPMPTIEKDKMLLENAIIPYQDLRSLMAKRAVARNSLNNIIAQKSFGPKIDDGEGSNAQFLRALVKDMGITDEDEITAILGERPSYWAQMEVLTKKLYQHPEFVVNLYDKPANVARMRASMRAIKVMQDRDISDALQRREMLLSILAELSVRREQNIVDTEILRLPSASPIADGKKP